MLELLAPAGSMSALKSAYLYGADACYIGGGDYSLRHGAVSFDRDAVREAVGYAHERGKKLHVAINAVVRSGEIEGVSKYAKFLESIGIDAVIVSDPGVFFAVKNNAPNLPIHISTQANIVNYETASFWYKMGAERVVLARELSLEEIKEIRAKTPKKLEIETFVHGAMCMSHSGRCLLSNYLTERPLDTYTIEAMMQDGKALQSGTSHFLGQNFGKAFDVQFLNKDNKVEYAWATSWGVSTRLMGALIMTHSDDNGLVLPPKLAPLQVVIIPIGKGDQMAMLNEKAEAIVKNLKAMGISVKYDNADNKRPGFKFADYELKGVPVRLVLGARDLEKGLVEVMRRDTLEKENAAIEGIEEYVKNLLDDIQNNIYKKAVDYRDAHIYECDNYDEFKERIKDGGFFLCHWDGTEETEARIKEETQATIRCVPYMFEQTEGVDMVSGKPAKHRVLIARAY